jgi:hypothetical protein
MESTGALMKLSIKSKVVDLLQKYNSKNELVFAVVNEEPLQLDQIYQDPDDPNMIVFSLSPAIPEDMKERIRQKAHIIKDSQEDTPKEEIYLESSIPTQIPHRKTFMKKESK